MGVIPLQRCQNHQVDQRNHPHVSPFRLCAHALIAQQSDRFVVRAVRPPQESDVKELRTVSTYHQNKLEVRHRSRGIRGRPPTASRPVSFRSTFKPFSSSPFSHSPPEITMAYGTTPVTFPPCLRTEPDTTPMIPLEPPPYTSGRFWSAKVFPRANELR